MTDHVTELAGSQEQLIQAVGKYGERWGIQQTDDHDGWIAVERLPPIEAPQPRIATSKTLGGLVHKLRQYQRVQESPAVRAAIWEVVKRDIQRMLAEMCRWPGRR